MKANCGLCGREKELTFHHYIPKTLHKNKLFVKMYKKEYMKSHGVDLCDDCHYNIHHFHTEKELGKYYNDMKKLLSSEKVRNFLKWVKKQA
jgi:hypothetical protein